MAYNNLLAQIDFVPIVITVLIGAVCGFLAGVILKGSGFGLVGNTVVGILGAFIGSLLFSLSGIDFGMEMVGEILTGTMGSVLLLVGLGFVQKAIGTTT